MSRRTWFGTHRRFFRRAAALCLALAVLFFVLCGWLSYRAAEIFDETAAGRDLFPGTVSAERVRADILGRVEIEGLRWTADDGTLLAEVPARVPDQPVGRGDRPDRKPFREGCGAGTCPCPSLF